MRIIVGLGNPGREYHKTRHNAGFMVVERLARRHGLAEGRARTRFHAGVIDGAVAGQRCLLMQPLTYMNRSGLAVAEAATFYKVAAADVMVVVDDVALPVGRMRLRAEGSAGGHHGLEDIERALGTRAYPRLRLGVDAPGPAPQADYVLSAFTAEQWRGFEPMIDRACDAIECWLTRGIDPAMTQFNAPAADG